MEHYVGIDVSLEESSVCIVDETGRIIREVKIASAPVRQFFIEFAGSSDEMGERQVAAALAAVPAKGRA